MLLARIKQEKKRKKISRKKRKIEWPFNQKKLSKWRARVRHSWRNNTQYPGGEGGGRGEGSFSRRELKGISLFFGKEKKKKKKRTRIVRRGRKLSKNSTISAHTRGEARPSIRSRGGPQPLPSPPPLLADQLSRPLVSRGITKRNIARCPFYSCGVIKSRASLKGRAIKEVKYQYGVSRKK